MESELMVYLSEAESILFGEVEEGTINTRKFASKLWLNCILDSLPHHAISRQLFAVAGRGIYESSDDRMAVLLLRSRQGKQSFIKEAIAILESTLNQKIYNLD